jgi:primosomal protein N' (replication factor Y)
LACGFVEPFDRIRRAALCRYRSNPESAICPAMPRLVPVLLPLALDRAYTYAVPEFAALQPGALVRVPIGPRQAVGCVWDGPADEVPQAKLKSIIEVLAVPPLSPELRRLVAWVANWTLAPLGMVLKLVIRSEEVLDEPASRRVIRASGYRPDKLTLARARVLDVTSDGLARPKGELARAAGVSAGVVDGLVAQGALDVFELPAVRFEAPDPDHARPALSPEQAAAAAALSADVSARRFATTLLQGVTGSGKTEVYFEAIAQALSERRQALILVPEIALTGEFLDRFATRFGARPAEWHSEMPPNRRPAVWRGVASGAVQVVVGARSALFLPFQALGLIVVDEEHDTAFKQEDGVIYHARDMAVVRGKIENLPVVLASATPSLESFANADAGRYAHLDLPRRFGARELPSIKPLDLKRDPPERGRWLAPGLTRAIDAALGRGEQALLFLNRRGYAPLTLCRACGHRFRCPNCAAWLVDHRFRRELVCHHCGHVETAPNACPACGTEGKLVGVGPGVERVAEEVRERFPNARSAVLSSDLGGITRLRAEIGAIARREVDIVIGTQLVAKGHNFPGLTLVGIVDADIGLASGDPRAAERTFQLLNQVVGRAGRGEAAGMALVQTHAPDHPVMAAIVAGDARAFYEREAEERRSAGLPPFGRLAAMLISGEDAAKTRAFARDVARAAPASSEIIVLGPAEAPLAVLAGRHRFRLLIKAPRNADLQGYLRAWLSRAPKARGSLRVVVDIDPQSFL